MRYTLCFILTCYIGLLQGQGISTLTSAHQVVSSGNDLMTPGAEGLYTNPAAIVHDDHSWDGLASYSNRYGIDIHGASAAIAYNFNNQAAGLLIGSYGITGFSQGEVRLAYARKLTSKTRLGIQANFSQLSIRDFGNESSLNMSIGVQQDLSDVWSVSATIQNPLNQDKSATGSSGLRLNSAARFSDNLYVFVGSYIPFGEKVSIRPGFKYQVATPLSIIWSMDTSPAAYNYGAEFHISNSLSSVLSLNSHPILGNSFHFSVGYIIR